MRFLFMNVRVLYLKNSVSELIRTIKEAQIKQITRYQNVCFLHALAGVRHVRTWYKSSNN